MDPESENNEFIKKCEYISELFHKLIKNEIIKYELDDKKLDSYQFYKIRILHESVCSPSEIIYMKILMMSSDLAAKIIIDEILMFILLFGTIGKLNKLFFNEEITPKINYVFPLWAPILALGNEDFSVYVRISEFIRDSRQYSNIKTTITLVQNKSEPFADCVKYRFWETFLSQVRRDEFVDTHVSNLEYLIENCEPMYDYKYIATVLIRFNRVDLLSLLLSKKIIRSKMLLMCIVFVTEKRHMLTEILSNYLKCNPYVLYKSLIYLSSINKLKVSNLFNCFLQHDQSELVDELFYQNIVLCLKDYPTETKIIIGALGTLELIKASIICVQKNDLSLFKIFSKRLDGVYDYEFLLHTTNPILIREFLPQCLSRQNALNILSKDPELMAIAVQRGKPHMDYVKKHELLLYKYGILPQNENLDTDLLKSLRETKQNFGHMLSIEIPENYAKFYHHFNSYHVLYRTCLANKGFNDHTEAMAKLQKLGINLENVEAYINELY
jgi:hypothetical protein